LIVLTLTLTGAGKPAADPDADAARIAKLISQLGSDSFAEREQARKELETVGTPALGALRKAVRTGDLETRRRATELIRVIEENNLTAALLTPKKVHLKLKDVPVLQAVERLAKLSGYALRVDGDRTVLADKTVTLDTGEVTFWEAVDLLSARAGVIEKQTVASTPGDPNTVGLRNMVFGGDVVAMRVGKKAPAKKLPPPLPPLRMMPVRKPAAGEEKKDMVKPVEVPVPEKKPVEPAKEPGKDAPPPRKELPKEVLDRLDDMMAPSEKGGDNGGSPPLQVIPGRVILAPGSTAKQHVSYAGAVRVVLTQMKKPTGAKSPTPAETACDLMLAATAEPRLLNFSLSGAPSVTRVVDEHGQTLSVVIDPLPAPQPAGPGLPGGLIDIDGDFMMRMPPSSAPRGVIVRLKPAAKPAKRLRELAGTLSAQVQVPNATLAVLDDILRGAGKSVDIKGGGRLVIEKVEKAPEAEFGKDAYILVYKHNNNTGPFGEGNAELLDAKGQRLTPTNGPNFNQEQDAEGQIVRVTVTVVYRREKDQGEPVRLRLVGTYLPTIVVPFRFVDVPLP
jgi:hypothetical protein